MARSIGRRVDELEAVFGAANDADLAIVERNTEGRIARVALRFAYRFDKTSAVVGIKVGKQIHARHLDEPLWQFRIRIISPPASVWKEILDQIQPSRGLLDFEGYELEVEATNQRRRAVAADAVRRKGETEWGERVIGLVALMEAND